MGISVTGFAAGAVVDFGGFPVNPMWTVTLPIGAIFLGVALISLILEKEVAQYDEEQAKRIALAREHVARPPAVPARQNHPTYENQAFQAVR